MAGFLEPKSVPEFQPFELIPDEALERWPQHRPRYGLFDHSAQKQVDVFYAAIKTLNSRHQLSTVIIPEHNGLVLLGSEKGRISYLGVLHNGHEVTPSGYFREAAKPAILEETRKSVVTASLEVQTHQVHAVAGILVLEQPLG